MSATIYHRHHIIPRHAGGTDDPSNLIRLTIAEHAEAHRVLWEQCGRLGNKMAWLMLSGKTEEAEAVRIELCRTPESRMKRSLALKGKHAGEKNPFYGKTHSDENRAKWSASKKGEKSPWYGKKLSPEHRAKMSESHKGYKLSPESVAKRTATRKLYRRMKRIVAPEATIHAD